MAVIWGVTTRTIGEHPVANSAHDHASPGNDDAPLPVRPTTAAVALYNVAPSESLARDVLSELAAYATARGWSVPQGCAASDVSRGPQGRRPGWATVRQAVHDRRIDGVAVPTYAHLGYSCGEWRTERSWLLDHDLFVIAMNPDEPLLGEDPLPSQHQVLYDPEALAADRWPLDRAVHEQLVDTVLAWDPAVPSVLPTPADALQIALQLTGYARVVVDEVEKIRLGVPPDAPAHQVAAEAVKETERRLSVPASMAFAVRHAQKRARLVTCLHRALDGLLTAPQAL